MTLLYPPSNVDIQLKSRIIAHEGKSRYAYTDTTGNLTIGIGRNIQPNSGKGLSENEMMFLLQNDLTECENTLKTLSWYPGLDNVRQGVCIEMVFNLGFIGFLAFKKMIQAIQNKDYSKACQEMKSSKWAVQIGLSRLNDLLKRMLTGGYE